MLSNDAISDLENNSPSTITIQEHKININEKPKVKKKWGFWNKSKKEKDENKPKPVSIGVLFQYATAKELILIGIGVLAACSCGACFPIMIIFFGGLTNAFVFSAQNLTQVAILANITEEELYEALGFTDFYEEVVQFGQSVSIIGVILFILGYIFVTTLIYAAEGQIFRLRSMMLHSILRQDIGWFDLGECDNFASRVTEDLNKLQDGIGDKIGLFCFYMSNCIFSLIIAFIYGWELTLVVLAVLPLLGISTGVIATVQGKYTTLELENYAKAGSIAEEVLSSIRTVVAFGGEQKEVERYKVNLIDAKNTGIKRGVITGVGMGSAWAIIFSSYALAFWYGIKLILDSKYPKDPNDYDPQDLIIVFFCVVVGAMYVGTAAPYLEAFNIARGAASSLYKIIEKKSSIDPFNEKGYQPKCVKGTIGFQNVHFNYPSRPNVQVLQGINIKVEKGQTVALVGVSGCGKSTCIQLIQRFYDPLLGSVTFDGIDLRDLNTGWLRDQIGVVGQEPVLFATSIEENIRLGKLNSTFDEIVNAAKEANVHDFIMALPKQYKTQVGERGVQISGGQKQRIAIARAIIKEPKILLLDEATSALDNQSEAIVQKALDKARKGRTTIIVAHRLSTIRSSDQILVFNNGIIVEQGTHNELMEHNGVYTALVTTQITPQEEDTEEEETPILKSVDATFNESDDGFMIGAEYHRRNSSVKISLKKRFSSKKKKEKDIMIEEKDKEEEVSVSELLKLNKSEWVYIMVGVFASVVQGALIPTYAVMFGNIMGTLSIEDSEELRSEGNRYSLYFLFLGILAGVSMLLQISMFSISGELLTMKLRIMTFAAMLAQEIGWYDEEKNSVGALCARLSGEASNVQGATGSRIGVIIQSLVTVIICLTLAMFYNWKLGLVSVPFMPFALVSMYYGAKLSMGQSESNSKIFEETGKIAVETISNIRTVSSLHKEKYFLEKHNSALVAPYKKSLKQSHIRGIIFGFANSAQIFAYAIVMFYGGYLIKEDGILYEDVFKVGEALIFGSMYVGQAVALAPNLGKAKKSAGRLFALIRRQPKIDSRSDDGLKFISEVRDIQLKDVRFNYPSRPTVPILRGVTAEILKGETVALVGSSGCGKSTIISLLERFYNSKSGNVDLNSVNIEDVNIGINRGLFGLVSQEPVLFDRTIADNIAYGDNRRSFSLFEIQQVAKQANIHDFVSELPEGYETRIGLKGAHLSGGQKQRIAIARALIRNPSVLLLDEATSALDAESEKIVQDTLEELQEGRTSIIIAHRLSTIRNASKIVVLKSGKIVEQGTHLELVAKKGTYYQLYQTNA